MQIRMSVVSYPRSVESVISSPQITLSNKDDLLKTILLRADKHLPFAVTPWATSPAGVLSSEASRLSPCRKHYLPFFSFDDELGTPRLPHRKLCLRHIRFKPCCPTPGSHGLFFYRATPPNLRGGRRSQGHTAIPLRREVMMKGFSQKETKETESLKSLLPRLLIKSSTLPGSTHSYQLPIQRSAINA